MELPHNSAPIDRMTRQHPVTRRTLLRAAMLAGVVTAIPFATLPATASADDLFALGRRQWRAYLVGAGLDKADPVVAARLKSIATTATSAMSTYVTASGRVGLWPDLSLQARATNADSARVTATARRLTSIALAWATDSLGANADRALAIVTDGVRWLTQDVFSPTTGVRYGNWYDWDVSVPQSLNDLLVLTYDALDADVRAAVLAAERRFSPEIPQTGTYAAAANRVLICDAFSGRGLLGDNAQDVDAARDNLVPVLAYARPFGGPVGLVDGNADEAAFFSNDGFYPDGSFIQHGQFPYVGGYGTSFLTSITAMAARTSATPWSSDLAIVSAWMHASFEPWLWRGLVMDTVRGRGLATVAGDKSTGVGFIAGMLNLLPSVGDAERARLASAIKAELGWRGADPTQGLGLPQTAAALAILRDPSVTARPQPVGTSVFGPMDRVLHRRRDWAVAFAMHSLRMADYETGSSENLRGWYTSDAATYLYTADQDQFGDGYWCTVDAYRIPGTTVDPVARPATAVPWRAEYHNPSFWAGGVSAGTWGAAGIDLTQKPPSTLHAKLSRFFFDDAYVCVGAGITVAADRTAETVVENRRMTAVSTGPLVVDGSAAVGDGESRRVDDARWAHVGGVGGYVLLGGANVLVRRERRTGKLSDISGTVTGTTATTVRTGDYLTLTIQHGRGATDGTYAYTVLPGADAEATAAYAARPGVRVVTQGADVQSVREESTGRFGAVFFAASAASIVTAEAPCAVAVEESDTVLRVHVSDPTQCATTVRVRLAARVDSVATADPRVRVETGEHATTLTVDVAGLTGATASVVLNHRPPTTSDLVSMVAKVIGTVILADPGARLVRLAARMEEDLAQGRPQSALAALRDLQTVLDDWLSRNPDTETEVAPVVDLASRLVARLTTT